MNELEVVVPGPALPASCPAATDFICQNGDCIESHLACDLKADCTDESDEQDCSKRPHICPRKCHP